MFAKKNTEIENTEIEDIEVVRAPKLRAFFQSLLLSIIVPFRPERMFAMPTQTEKQSAQTQKQVVRSPKFGQSAAPLSTAIKANGFLFISGQVGRDMTTGTLQSSSFEAEAHQIMKNIGTILNEAGLTFGDLVSVTIYLKDMGNFSRVNEVYKTYFTGDFPTRTCIAVADLPVGASVEMTVTAALR